MIFLYILEVSCFIFSIYVHIDIVQIRTVCLAKRLTYFFTWSIVTY